MPIPYAGATNFWVAFYVSAGWKFKIHDLPPMTTILDPVVKHFLKLSGISEDEL